MQKNEHGIYELEGTFELDGREIFCRLSVWPEKLQAAIAESTTRGILPIFGGDFWVDPKRPFRVELWQKRDVKEETSPSS
jgi:hypothetical protein